MEYALAVLALLVVSFMSWRRYWMRSEQPREFTADFDGRLLRAGDNVIAIRDGDEGANRSIICFPGFLEDMRYFLALYAEEECQLILVNNAAYHVPFDADEVRELDWEANPYRSGTIEYDGFHLAHVLKHLATGSEVLLHGHSRGGAVVLEAGRQFPEWTRSPDHYVRAILEAAVLPGGKVAGPASQPLVFALLRLLLPIVLGLSRKAPVEKLLEQPMMRPTNPYKTEMCRSVYFTPIRYATCVTNVCSIRDWQRDTSTDAYAAYERIDVVIGERDDVLDNPSMIASAEEGATLNAGVSLVRTENTNHFVTLEEPDYLRALL